MAAATISKGCASCIAYSPKVIRTWLWKEGTKYKSFVQPLSRTSGKKVTLPFIEYSLPNSSSGHQILPLCCLLMS